MSISMPRNVWAAEEARINQHYTERASYKRDYYSPFHPSALYQQQETERAILGALRNLKVPLAEAHIVDVGCGYGPWLSNFIRWGAKPKHIAGIDLRLNYAEGARNLLPAACDIRQGNAAELPWENASFDITFVSLMLSNIAMKSMLNAICYELYRVTKPGGVILSYDLRVNNPRNPAIRGIRTKEMRTLFPSCRVSTESLTLFPWLSRRLAPWSVTAARALSAVPPLRTHLLATMVKQ